MADMPKPTEERILVCVSPSPSSAQLISAASKMATSLHAKWSAVYVEQPKMAMLPEAERSRAADNLRLAGRLGAETVTLVGRNVAEEIVDFARQRNVTRIIVGKPARPSWRGILSRSPVDRLVRISRDIDVYVTTGEPGEQREPAYVIRPERIHLSDYGAGVSVSRPGHRDLLCDVPLLPPHQPHHGVPAGGDAHRHWLRARASDPDVSPERSGLRLFFRPSPIFVHRGREPVHRHLRGDGPGGSGHQSPGCRDAAANRDRPFAGAGGGGHARSQSATRQHPRG